MNNHEMLRVIKYINYLYNLDILTPNTYDALISDAIGSFEKAIKEEK